MCASLALVNKRLRALRVVPPSKAHPRRGHTSDDQGGQGAGQSHGFEQEKLRGEMQHGDHEGGQCGTYESDGTVSEPPPTHPSLASEGDARDPAHFATAAARTVDCRTADVACTDDAEHAGHGGPSRKRPAVEIRDWFGVSTHRQHVPFDRVVGLLRCLRISHLGSSPEGTGWCGTCLL